jgi:hypothetical protein
MTKPIRLEHLKPCVDWWGGAKRKGRKETEVSWKVTADEVKTRGTCGYLIEVRQVGIDYYFLASDQEDSALD